MRGRAGCGWVYCLKRIESNSLSTLDFVFFFSLYSRTPPKSSSPDAVKQQIANQSETGAYVSGLRVLMYGIFCLPIAFVVCPCSIMSMSYYELSQGKAMGSTAVPRSTSTTVVSQVRTLTRDASQSCLSLLALEIVSLCSKR